MTRRDIHLLLWFGGGSLLLFFLPLFAGETHFSGDILYSFHPWFTYAAQNIQSGEFPLWNPFSACGESFIGNPQIMLFYPWRPVFLDFPFPVGWTSFLAFHQWLLFTATGLAVRSFYKTNLRTTSVLLAAVSMTWGGFVTVLWEFPGAVASLPFLLLFFILGLTRRWLSFSLSLSLLLLAGYTPFAYYAVLLGAAGMGVQVFFRRGDRRSPDWKTLLFWSAALGAGIAACAPQILSTWEAARHSLRAMISPSEARNYLLTPIFLIKFLVPEIFDKVALPFQSHAFGAEFWPVQRNWLNTFFIGTLPLLLALAALTDFRKRKNLFWGAVILFSAAMAMGWDPVFSAARTLIPGFRYMTHFSHLILLTVVSLVFLAADGGEAPARKPLVFWGLWGGAFLLVIALAAFPTCRLFTLKKLLGTALLSPAQDRHVAGAAAKTAVILLGAGALALCPARVRGWGFVFLTLAELRFFAIGFHPTVSMDFFKEPVTLQEKLQAAPGRYAVDPETVRGPKFMAGETLAAGYQSLRQALYPNIQLPFRIRSTWGYEVFPEKNFSEFRRNIPSDNLGGAPARFLGIDHVLSTRPLPPPAELLARAPHALLYSFDDPLPLVGWVPLSRKIADPQERLSFLSSPWDPTKEVILEEEESVSAGIAPVPGKPLRRLKERSSYLEVAGEGAGWVVRGETFHSGWNVYVNGQHRRLMRANHAFQAAKTPPGGWTAVFLYRPKMFRRGLGIGLAALLGLGFGAVLFMRRTALR